MIWILLWNAGAILIAYDMGVQVGTWGPTSSSKSNELWRDHPWAALVVTAAGMVFSCAVWPVWAPVFAVWIWWYRRRVR